MATRTLTVKIVGDVAKGEQAMIGFANSIQKAERQTDVSSRKIRDDLAKLEAQAVKAAAANEKLGAVGSKTSTLGGLGRNIAEASLQGGVSPLSTVQSSLLGQLGGAETILSGISTKALLAGAGIAVAGIAATKFGVDSVQAFTSGADAVDKFQDVAGGSAEQASVFVGAAQQLGVSTDALGVSMGRLLKGANANEKAFQSYGATVFRTKEGSVDAVKTFESVAQAFAKTTDPAKRAELGTLAFGRGWQQIIDVLERGGPVLDSFFQSAAEHAPIFSQEDLQNAVDFKQSIVELNQEWTKFKDDIGGQIVPPLTDTINAIDATGVALKTAGDNAGPFKSTLDTLGGLAKLAVLGPVLGTVSAVGGVVRALTGDSDNAANAVHGMGEAARNSAAGLDEWGNAAGSAGDDAVGATYKFINMGQALYAGAAAASSAASAWQAATADMRSIHDVTENYNTSLATLDDLNAKVQGSSSTASTAVDHSARQIGDAQKSVQDAIDGVAQAEADYARTAADVQQGLVDTEESAAKSIVDAQQKVIDARKAAADQALSSSRSVTDAEQALRDAEVNALKESDPYKSQRVREDATLRLQRAQEDAASATVDSAKGVSDAQKDLADVEVKAGKDRAKAQQDAADKMVAAQKQIADANDRVSQATEALSRQISDAAEQQDKAASSAAAAVPSHQELGKALQGVADNAFNQAYQMKLAGASDAEISAFLATTTTTISTYGQAWGFTGDEIAYYNRQVAQMNRQINIQYNLSLNLDQYYSKLNEAGKAVGTTGAQLLADAGELGITPILHDTGGWLPTGLSLSLNKTGRPERVLAPDESVGGGTTIIVQGSVISDRDLADIIAKAQRRGVKGFN